MPNISIGFNVGPKVLQASRGLFSVESPAGNFTKTGSATAYKWHPGHYAGSNTFIQTGGSPISSELTSVSLFNRVIGYKLYMTWGSITQNGTDFSPGIAIVQSAINSLKSMTNGITPNGKFLIVSIMSGTFSHSDVPAYIYNNPIYGASSTPGYYGFWNACAAIHRPLVLAEYIKAWQAILSHFDGDPNFEGGLHQEDSFWISSLDSAPDWDSSGGTFLSATQSLISGCVSAVTQTTVAYQGTYQVTRPQSNALMQSMYTNRCLPAETDTYGYSDTNRPPGNLNASGWDWGASAYFGNTGTDYRPLTGFFNDVEPYDLGATYGGTCHADNGQGYLASDILQSINQIYRGTHPTWAILGAGDNPGGAGGPAGLANNVWGTVGSGGLGDFLNNPSNALIYSTYPANYP